MKKPTSFEGLERLGRQKLSRHFWMRDFLYSEIGNFHGIPNIPDDPEQALAVGQSLATDLLEPLVETFGPISIRSSYRSPTLNEFGNKQGMNCASNERNRAGHIWDQADESGRRGACTCIFIPWFTEQYENGRDYLDLAWWLYDHIPFHAVFFFPKLAAFNLTWREEPERLISSYIGPRRKIAAPDVAVPDRPTRAAAYQDFPPFRGISYPGSAAKGPANQP